VPRFAHVAGGGCKQGEKVRSNLAEREGFEPSKGF
jgi:hypothetical protein